ncbi:MAG: adenine-specific methyltransferase EcoRI family protein [Clostridia bacterium]|nr:adenine-specific methyltransferase EcoRI family protein [Clostridia bacterium]
MNSTAAKRENLYTRLNDIELECRNYRKQFRGKTILCNCDDPYESNFFKYFAINFNRFGLKKLVSTSYASSPYAGEEMSLSEMHVEEGHAYKIELTSVDDVNGDGAADIEDVKWLLRNDRSVVTQLEGDGDFRSPECVELLKEADIIVSFPPFPLFHEYLKQIMDYGKKFLVIIKQDVITYKEVFPSIVSNVIKYGVSIHSGGRDFRAPADYPVPVQTSMKHAPDGKTYVHMDGVRWLTNLDCSKHCDPLYLSKSYSPEEYPRFDNYDAINVNACNDIPCDYYGAIGVPISFMNCYNPEQFEIVGCTESEGRGFSNGLWKGAGKEDAKPVVGGVTVSKRLFIRRLRDSVSF